MYSLLYRQEIIWDLFSFLAFIIGTYSGSYLLWRVWVNRKDKALLLNLSLLGIATLYHAFIYAGILFGLISSATTSYISAGILLRPVVLFLLAIPAQIVKRMQI